MDIKQTIINIIDENKGSITDKQYVDLCDWLQNTTTASNLQRLERDYDEALYHCITLESLLSLVKNNADGIIEMGCKRIVKLENENKRLKRQLAMLNRLLDGQEVVQISKHAHRNRFRPLTSLR